jgi:hypothetical protein
MSSGHATGRGRLRLPAPAFAFVENDSATDDEEPWESAPLRQVRSGWDWEVFSRCDYCHPFASFSRPYRLERVIHAEDEPGHVEALEDLVRRRKEGS